MITCLIETYFKVYSDYARSRVNAKISSRINPQAIPKVTEKCQ